MDTVSDMFLTNIPSSAISDLVKLQLSNSTPWNIQTYSISGKTDEYRHRTSIRRRYKHSNQAYE